MKIVFVCKDFSGKNFYLQPWYFVYGLSTGLGELGHDISIITKAGNQNLNKIQLLQCNSFSNKEIAEIINRTEPHLIVWNYGVTSSIKFLIEKSLRKYKNAVIFTSPKYSMIQIIKALRTIGFKNAIKSFDSLAIHILGSLIPWFFIRTNLKINSVDSIIVLSSNAKKGLNGYGIKPSMLLPTISSDFEVHAQTDGLKEKLGLPKESSVVLFAGNPLPLRGSQLLIDSFIIARKNNPNLHLILLIRTESQFHSYINDIKNKIKREELDSYVIIVDQSVSRKELIAFYNIADVVALPFVLVPSEAPFTIMEVHRLGKPAIVSNIAGLPDMALTEDTIIKPFDKISLARALSEGNWSPPGNVSFKSWKETAQEFLLAQSYE